jgi:hypothetical protein
MRREVRGGLLFYPCCPGLLASSGAVYPDADGKDVSTPGVSESE